MDPALSRRPWLRRLISLLLVWHITAVAVAPMADLVASFPPRAEPPLGGPPRPGGQNGPSGVPGDGSTQVPARIVPPIVRFANAFQPYLDLLYLNHGYSFFAPEPGASYVMEYEVERPDGTTVRGRLPDIRHHWPRLLYHRYFMLATQNWGLEQAVARGRKPDPQESLAHAIVRHLNQVHGGERAELRLFLHRLLWPEEILQGKQPEAPDTYIPMGVVTHPPSASPPEELDEAEAGRSAAGAQEVRP